MPDENNDDAHMTPFLQALYDCVKTHGPDDNLDLLRDLFTACGATAAMMEVVREDPEVAMNIMREVLSSAIVAYNAVLAMHAVHDTSGDEDIIWMNNSIVGEA